MTSLFARATRRSSLAHFRHVTPVRPGSARGLVADVYRRMEDEFGMLAPPLVLHAAVPRTLAGCWLILRETLLARGVVGRADKEAVAAAVSLANRCPYCVDVHGTTLTGLLRHPDARLVTAGRLDAVSDPALRALVRWVAGATPERPPLPGPAAAEVVGTALAFHYINRMVNVFLRDSPLPPVSGAAREAVLRGAARVMVRLARRDVRPGTDADLLPPARLPFDLSWAAARPPVAGALARAVAAIEEGGRRSVPAAVRATLLHTLDEGVTAVPHPGGAAWLDRRTAGLAGADVPVARLVLLTALGSYRVTDDVIAGCRRGGRDDAALVDIAAWASMTAARRLARAMAGDGA